MSTPPITAPPLLYGTVIHRALGAWSDSTDAGEHPDYHLLKDLEVTFRPSIRGAVVQLDPGTITVVPTKVVGRYNAQGNLVLVSQSGTTVATEEDIRLLANVDNNMQPPVWAWRVTWSNGAFAKGSFNIAPGETFDLSSVILGGNTPDAPQLFGDLLQAAAVLQNVLPQLEAVAQSAQDAEASAIAARDDAVAITGLTGEDAAVAFLAATPTSATRESLESTFPVKGGATRRFGQNIKNFRRPTLVVDKAFPNARHDHQIVWVDETLKEAWSIGQDRALRKATWSAQGDEALAFGTVLSRGDASVAWAPHGVFMRISPTVLLMEEANVGNGRGNSKLLRSTDGGRTWATAFAFPTNVGFLGPQSLCADEKTGHLYLVEYTVAVAITEARIMRSTDQGATWNVFKTVPRTEGGPASWRHIHSCRYDDITERVYFAVGDQNPDAGIWRVNSAGDDVEPVILNSQLATMFPGNLASARAVDIMFFPTHVAWGSDGAGGVDGDWVFRMPRTSIGSPNPTVERVAPINTTGWYAIKAASDGSRWVLASSSESTSVASDLSPHIYAVTDNGSAVDEVGAVDMGGDNIGFATLSGLGSASGEGVNFWLRAHNYQEYPNVTYSSFQMRCSLVWGVIPVGKPTHTRQPEILRESRNWVGELAANETNTVAYTRTPRRASRLHILNIGYRVMVGGGAGMKIELYNGTKGIVVWTWAGGPDWRAGNTTTQVLDSLQFDEFDEVYFRVVETAGAAITGSMFVEFGWVFG